MVNILTTLLQPTSGHVTVLGRDVVKEPWFIKNNIGLMLGGDMIYHRLSGFKNLKFFCKIYSIKNFKEKIHKIAEELNLSEWLNQYVENYSTGMKLKLALARVLLTEPQVLFLDEPMLGLDPKMVNEVIEIIRRQHKTTFFTSHQMNVVQQLCNRIAFLKEGKILKVGSQSSFRKILTPKIKIQLIIREKKKDLIELLTSLNFVENIKSTDKFLTFDIHDEKDYPKLFSYLKDFEVLKINQIESDLYDVFITLS